MAALSFASLAPPQRLCRIYPCGWEGRIEDVIYAAWRGEASGGTDSEALLNSVYSLAGVGPHTRPECLARPIDLEQRTNFSLT